MSSREEVTLPTGRQKSRKSLAHIQSSQRADQENMTADIAVLMGGKKSSIEKLSKKSRSKSIGPGGLDALKDTTGNRRKSLATVPHPPPKSILKPTMPPLRDIPAHISTRPGLKESSPPKGGQSNELIDFNTDSTPGPTVTGTDDLPNPFQVEGSAAVNETRVTLRSEEELQTAAREREEIQRQELESEINLRRAARRKSLANRRVSFAPEATLHTWDVVVEYQDSTTSSNSTNSTRRASSASGDISKSSHLQNPGPTSSDPSESHSTSPEQVVEDAITSAPEHQHDQHKKKRRRSSGIPPMNFNNPDDEAFSSSPFSGSSVGDAEVIENDEDAGSNSNSGSDDGDSTMMSIDGGESIDLSIASIKSASSGSSVRLEEALRLASRQAGSQEIEFDEHGDAERAEDEVQDEEVVASFAPWTKKSFVQNLESLQDQENINPFSGAFKAAAPMQDAKHSDEGDITMDMTRAVGGILPRLQGDDVEEDDELSMDVTRAFGGIMPNESSKQVSSRRRSMQSSYCQSTNQRRSGEESSLEDETMDLTVAMGGIQTTEDVTTTTDDEDMTMEFTSVVGGVLPQGNPSKRSRRRSSMTLKQKRQNKGSRLSLDSAASDDTMDMTVAVGGILPSIAESIASELDATIEMDMTTAVGRILLPQSSTGSRSQAKRIMELETDMGSSPFQAEAAASSSPKVLAPIHTIASETGSPSLAAFRGKSLRRSTDGRHSITPKSKFSNGTSEKKPVTPPEQRTPQLSRPKTPSKTPPSKNVGSRTSSPRRLFNDDSKTSSSTPQSSETSRSVARNKLFQKDKGTGVATPKVVLEPRRRVSSGIGIDKEGLGSPRVAALLDRRGSIGDHARPFVPSQLEDGSRLVRFDDPPTIEEEIDKDREQENDRESGFKVSAQKSARVDEDKDATLNLKEMIQSLTPKKKPLQGRKSLHVGAAKGVLGKRPIELDEDDEDDEDNAGMKRLKGHQGSPVKNVKLQGPPSKAETTGRLTRAVRRSLENAPPSASFSPVKDKVTTPYGQRRFKDTKSHATGNETISMAEKSPVEHLQISQKDSMGDRMQLQDFLNMTSIRFMELTTTKRRHTIAPKASNSRDCKLDESNVSLEDCVGAGAATIPMLELFQHACHELKSYISEGRKTVREIETETFEENPPLFREYISAPPDAKVVIDNQLKNVKTHARLLSKGMWYEWRMTLLGTLRDGFFKMADDMAKDEETLDLQQSLLNSVLPQLVQQSEELEREESELQSAAEELANCNQEELSDARQQLITVDTDIKAKKQMIAELRKQLQDRETAIASGIERKDSCLEDIQEAERIREECRGWSSTEISALKAQVDHIEKEYGWTITGVSGSTTSMTYRKEIELVFDASSFQLNNSNARNPLNSPIDLWYIAASRELDPLPLTPEKGFFLQSIRDQIRGLPQAQTQIKNLLQAVSMGWNKASAAGDGIRLLRLSCPTEITKTSDNSILVKSTLLIVPLTTKVEIAFHLTSRDGESGIIVEISPSATVVYGERFNEPKMREFLLNRCGDSIEEKSQTMRVSWGAAVAELGEKLLARGRK